MTFFIALMQTRQTIRKCDYSSRPQGVTARTEQAARVPLSWNGERRCTGMRTASRDRSRQCRSASVPAAVTFSREAAARVASWSHAPSRS